MNKPRYCITYWRHEDDAYEVKANTIKEAEALYDMIGDEAEMKVLWDTISETVIKQNEKDNN